MPIKPTPPNRAELEIAWEDFQSRAFQCFTQLVWIVDIRPRLKEPVPRRRKLIANATVESTLLAVRDLDDFFSSTNGHGDDIRAAHYGYTSPDQFLTSDERTSINKKLIHLTFRAARERIQNPDAENPRQWDAADLVERAMGRVFPFLDYLESDFFRGDASKVDDIQVARRGITEYLNALKAVAEIERAIFAADED